MRTGVPCNENRFFPVWKTSQGKPCSGPVLALYGIAVRLVCNLLLFLSDKCNTEIDCKDKSDEHNCDFMFFGEQNYAKELIPRDEGGFHLL